jgi:Kef-type K+ transport system membrane component KefB
LLAGAFSAQVFFTYQKKQIANTGKRRWLMAFAVLLFVLSFFYYCNTLYLSNANAFKVHFAVAYPIGIAVICVAAYLGYKLSKKSENSELLSRVLFLAAVSLVTLLIISATK